VAFATLPLFAFFNTGVSLGDASLETFTHPVPLGITLGLFLGKQLGVFLFCMAGVLLGLARLPRGVTPVHLYGVALLCGIGFTMSLFIGSLAFEEASSPYLYQDRIGILGGSFISALLGYFWLKKALP